eukprot:GHVU01060466.1.p1 GENE.GHVU01060466.1~~GHVU01060466.1.p1  ORF type:complete len:106 (+),score=5.86 GHVU01060466.1:371-688(+)
MMPALRYSIFSFMHSIAADSLACLFVLHPSKPASLPRLCLPLPPFLRLAFLGPLAELFIYTPATFQDPAQQLPSLKKNKAWHPRQKASSDSSLPTTSPGGNTKCR